MNSQMVRRASSSPWLMPCEIRPRASIRLVCLAHAGGNASMYFSWSKDLGDDVELWTVQLPGRGMRMSERPWTSFDTILASVAPAIASLTDKPIAIFGHSLGARLGFETARWLRRHGYPAPLKLFASASVAPHVVRGHQPFSALPERELIEKLRQFDGIPESALANPELLEIVLPVVRADFAVAESYSFRVEDALPVPIDALYGLHDPEISRDQAALWRGHTSLGFQLRGFPGGHFYLQADPRAVIVHVSQVLSSLTPEPIA